MKLALRFVRSPLDYYVPQALDLESIQSHRWLVQPCSAYTGDHLVDGLDWVVQDVASRVYYGTAQTAEGINPLP